jgi:hypothetical protein
MIISLNHPFRNGKIFSPKFGDKDENIKDYLPPTPPQEAALVVVMVVANIVLWGRPYFQRGAGHGMSFARL